MELRKAERRKLKARIGISGASGSGKTYSSLLIAYGLTGAWEDICVIDTENGRGELYVNTNRNGIAIGEYNIITLDPPFTPQRYAEALTIAENAGMKAIIVDSLSHAWAGSGGLLEIKDRFAQNERGGDFTAWRKISPMHNQLVDRLNRSPAHLILTTRTKTEWVLEPDANGKTKPRRIGTAPVFRDGLEYEMTLFFDISPDHIANASKDNTGLFDLVPFTPSFETGKAILNWLNEGKDAPAYEPPKPEIHQAQAKGVNWSAFWSEARKLGFDQKAVHEIAGVESIKDWTPEQIDSLLAQLKAKKGAA